MNELLYILIGVGITAVIAAVGIVFLIKHNHALQEEIAQKQQELDTKAQEQMQLAAEISAQQKESAMLREQMQAQKAEAEHLREEEKRTRAEEQAKSMNLLKEQVTNLTQQLLQQRSEELNGQNKQSIGHIIDPLQNTIEEMKRAMQENKDAQLRNATSFEEQMKNLIAHTTQVQDSANRLTTALSNDSQVQGHWGETVLKSILDAQGLHEGVNYELQTTLRDAAGNVLYNDETGSKMRPDVIVHMDQTRDLIIDSKVSLTAFIAYQNAQTDEERKVALEQHIRSMRKHVKELLDKNYARYILPPRKSLDFVMMFVPHESALQLALYADASLWHDAMEKGVFIVGEMNLYAAMRAVELTWTQIQQAENHQQVYALAEELISRVGDFLERHRKMGEHLAKVQNEFVDCERKLTTGQSVLSSARKLVSLGAKMDKKHALPE